MTGKIVMYDLVRSKLTKVRRIVEQADDPFLLYLIDIAIIEAEVLSANGNLRTLDIAALERDDCLERADGSLAN